MTNFCSNCGNEVKQIEARFCVNCGHTLLNTKSNVNEHETHTHSNSEINIFLDIYNKISNLPKSAKLCLWSLSVLLGLYFFLHAYRLNELIISDFGIEQINYVKRLNESLEKIGAQQITATDDWEIHRNIYILEGLFFISLPWTFQYFKSFLIRIFSYFKATYETILLKFNTFNNDGDTFQNEFNNSPYTKSSKYFLYTLVLISLTDPATLNRTQIL